MLICAGKIEQFKKATPIGIGLIETTSNLTQICLKEKPKNLHFIGTAGSYGNKKIFEIVETNSASNIEQSFLKNNSYSPIIKELKNSSILNSSNYITTNNANRYLEIGLEIENMEFYAVYFIAKKFQIDLKGTFIITNYCNQNAHKEFIKNHK